MAQTT